MNTDHERRTHGAEDAPQEGTEARTSDVQRRSSRHPETLPDCPKAIRAESVDATTGRLSSVIATPSALAAPAEKTAAAVARNGHANAAMRVEPAQMATLLLRQERHGAVMRDPRARSRRDRVLAHWLGHASRWKRERYMDTSNKRKSPTYSRRVLLTLPSDSGEPFARQLPFFRGVVLAEHRDASGATTRLHRRCRLPKSSVLGRGGAKGGE